MTKTLLSTSLLIGLLATAHIEAQSLDTSPTPPPQAPFVAEPKPGTRWELTLSERDENSKKNGATDPTQTPTTNRPIRIQTHYGSNLSHIIQTWSDGTTTEGYVKNGFLYQIHPQTHKAYALTSQDNRPDEPYFVSGYQGTTWVTLADYKGAETIGKDKEKCYRFERVAIISTDSFSPSIPDLALWVRVQDKTPLRIKIGPLTFDYSPIATASAKVDLPTNVEALIQQVDREQQALQFMRQSAK